MLQVPPLSDRFAAINTEMGALEDQLSDALAKVPQTLRNCDGHLHKANKQTCLSSVEPLQHTSRTAQSGEDQLRTTEAYQVLLNCA